MNFAIIFCAVFKLRYAHFLLDVVMDGCAGFGTELVDVFQFGCLFLSEVSENAFGPHGFAHSGFRRFGIFVVPGKGLRDAHLICVLNNLVLTTIRTCKFQWPFAFCTQIGTRTRRKS